MAAKRTTGYTIVALKDAAAAEIRSMQDLLRRAGSDAIPVELGPTTANVTQSDIVMMGMRALRERLPTVRSKRPTRAAAKAGA
jgi:hypothetical protein